MISSVTNILIIAFKYFGLQFDLAKHGGVKESERVNKAIHDSLSFMLSNLSYTTNEDRYLEKCINWYRGKLNASARSRSEMMRNSGNGLDDADNMSSLPKKIVLSNDYYRRAFISPGRNERVSSRANSTARSKDLKNSTYKEEVNKCKYPNLSIIG